MGTLLEELILFISPSYKGESRIAPTVAKAAVLFEKHGATVALTLAKKVTHVVANKGDNNDSLEKARALGIPIVTLQYFLDSIVVNKLLPVDDDYEVLGSSPTQRVSKANKTIDVVKRAEPAPKPAMKRARQPSVIEIEDEKGSQLQMEGEPEEPKRKKAKPDDAPAPKFGAKAGVEAAEVDPHAPEGKVFEDDQGPWSVLLHNTEDTHNKFYILQLLTSDEGPSVFSRWGRIGAKGQQANAPCDDLDSAQSLFESVFRSKSKNKWSDRPNFVDKSGAYRFIGNSPTGAPSSSKAKASPATPAKPAAPVKKAANAASSSSSKGSFPMPMKLEHIDLEDIQKYLKNDDWVCEQKVDGIRCTAAVTKEGEYSFGSSTGGQLVSGTAAKYFDKLKEALVPTDEDYTLDGELMWTGEYHVFDILQSGSQDIMALNLAQRRRILEALFDHCEFQEPVRLLPQAKDTASKQELFNEVEKMGGEGVVLKLTKGKYKPGSRTKEQLKVKFRKTCDCVVTARNQGKTSNALLAVYDKGKLRQVGKCSMIGKEDAQPGDVVEVAYLYATDAMILYQPSLVRIRTDKAATDCSLNQLVPVNKRVLVEDDLDEL